MGLNGIDAHQGLAAVQNKKQSVEKTDSNTGTARLSDKAQKYLDELKKKYGGMDIMVQSYSSDEEADSILAKGDKSKAYSVLIDPETLEQMANDEDARAKYEGILSGVPDQFKNITDSLGEDASQVKSLSVSIGKDGKVSYFATLEESSKKQADRIAEKQEEKKTEARKQKVKRLKAESADELLDKIKAALQERKADELQTEDEKKLGQTIDFRA